MDGYGLGYLYFSDFGRATDIIFLVGWLPDPPDQINIHIENKIKPLTRPPFSLIFSLSLLSYSVTTTSPALSPSFTLSFLPLFHCHRLTAASSKLPLLSRRSRSWRSIGVPDLGVCLGFQIVAFQISAFSWARSHQIWWDLIRSSEILIGFWLDLIVFCHGTTISSNQRKPDQPDHNRPTNPITDPPDLTSLMDGQRILSLQTRLSRLG